MERRYAGIQAGRRSRTQRRTRPRKSRRSTTSLRACRASAWACTCSCRCCASRMASTACAAACRSPILHLRGSGKAQGENDCCKGAFHGVLLDSCLLKIPSSRRNACGSNHSPLLSRLAHGRGIFKPLFFKTACTASSAAFASGYVS